MIICAVNRKGGVGKTQFCFQVSSALAATNRKVLCLDLDPQASLSQIWFGSKAVESMPKSRTIAAVFDPEYDPLPEHIVHLTTILNISVIPSSNDLTEHNLPLSHHPDGVTPLTPFLREIQNEYDVVIIDCPPNLQFCSFSALLVSDFVVVVVPPEDTSAQGLIYVRAAIKEAMNCGNSSLSLLGYLLTIYNRQLSVHKAYEKMLRQEYGDLVFEHQMILASAFKESVAKRTPVSISAPKSAAAESMRLIVDELLARTSSTQVVI